MIEGHQNSGESIVLEEVPQLSKITGVSCDYRNEYLGLKSLLEFGIEAMRDELKEPDFLMKKYGERFPSTTFKDVITEKNKSAVQRIDELADILNRKAKDPDSFTEAEFLEIYNELEPLIMGVEFVRRKV